MGSSNLIPPDVYSHVSELEKLIMEVFPLSSRQVFFKKYYNIPAWSILTVALPHDNYVVLEIQDGFTYVSVGKDPQHLRTLDVDDIIRLTPQNLSDSPSQLIHRYQIGNPDWDQFKGCLSLIYQKFYAPFLYDPLNVLELLRKQRGQPSLGCIEEFTEKYKQFRKDHPAVWPTLWTATSLQAEIGVSKNG